MTYRRRTAAAAFVALATAGSLAAAHSPAEADFSPQPQDVVSTGSDIIQNSFNFLADGYGQLPGYNTAGNRYRFVNFDSSGDAQGRSAFTDPRLLPTITGNGTLGESGAKYVKQSDIKLLNPTISLRAGQDLVVRPSGGGGGGRDAIINDDQRWIDVGRSPDVLTPENQALAFSKLNTKLLRVQIATDRQLIATSTTTNAPATISAEAILNIYKGTWKTWGDIPGYSGPAPTETIVPLLLPTDAGMWNTFVANVRKQNPGVTVTPDSLRANPNSIGVQQNDPTAITALPEAQRKNAIVPFPRGRFRTLNSGYYTVTSDGSKTNNYNTENGHRTPASAAGIQLLDGTTNTDVLQASAPYGGNFAYNAIIREDDLLSDTPWQPGSTLNWVEALFYNPDGPEPFVRTPAGEALLEAAGVTPEYHVFGTDNAEIDLE
ncbi:substrate-binding domain-containing protein [Nocardioides sp. 503]|uniref:substrate-binding domain-containing protein n=1 Tax=Nocardioides sp. 503 TaxID=2508326 RepID=UPI00107040D1|nr:substrate-binding domain-containing protein [Nocardioides sp. 503]